MVRQGYVAANDTARLVDRIEIDLTASPSYRGRGALLQSDILMLDIIATTAATGWTRPIYWCATVGTGRSDKFYQNAKRFLWGGADTQGRKPYYDETAGRMLTTMRTYMLLGAKQYYREGQQATESGDKARADKLYAQAADLLRLITEKQPASIRPYGIQLGPDIANLYYDLGQATGNDKLRATGRDLMERQVLLYGAYVRYEQNIHIAFPGTAISIETDQSPLRYWGMVEAYQRMGGDYARLKAANPVLQGLDETTLRAKYDQVRASRENPDLSEGAMQVEMNARRIVGLKDMSPAEYARQQGMAR